jgi:tRNA (guanosine-2'-O-)-methyltransferase
VQQLGGTALKRLNRTWRRRATMQVGLLLQDVESPFNVGAIVRSAAVLGVDHLYVVGRSASPATPKAQKLAMGTDRYLQVRGCATIREAVDAAHADGYHVVGLELTDTSAPMHELDLRRDVCVAVGNEARGMSAEMIAACDALAYIPQLGKVGSLNVAAAVTIAAYELRRQEWAHPLPE